MKKKILLVSMCLLMALSPLTALAETMFVNTSNGGGVNLRLGPSTEDEVIAYVGYGEAVDVIELLAGSSWASVNYNGYYGFIMLRYLSYERPIPNPTFWPTFVPAPTVRPTARPNPKPTSNNNSGSLEKTLAGIFARFSNTDYNAIVVPSTPTTYVNLRWAPSKSAPVRAQYWAGTTLEVISTNGEWSEVYDPQTQTHGFMMSNFLTPTVNPVGVGSDS